MPGLKHVEGIGAKHSRSLNKAGIRGTASLLKKGGTKKGRQELAKKSGVSEKLILEWVNHADLYRVKGIGSEYADLLEESGVDTVVELSNRSPANLHKKVEEVNKKKKLVRLTPGLKRVESWVKHAKKLPRAVHH